MTIKTPALILAALLTGAATAKAAEPFILVSAPYVWAHHQPPPGEEGRPPDSSDRVLVQTDGAPIRDWQQEAAFDSAKECEAERTARARANSAKGWQRPELFIRCVPAHAYYCAPTVGKATQPGARSFLSE